MPLAHAYPYPCPASWQAGAPNPLSSHITFDVFAKALKPTQTLAVALTPALTPALTLALTRTLSRHPNRPPPQGFAWPQTTSHGVTPFVFLNVESSEQQARYLVITPGEQ